MEINITKINLNPNAWGGNSGGGGGNSGEKIVLLNGICLSGSTFTELDMSQWDWKVRDFSNMFRDCNNLVTITNIPSIKIDSMQYCFSNCGNLTSLDLSNWDTSYVTNMNSCFSSCRNLTSLDLSNWDTSNVTDMSGCFDGCSALKTINGIDKFNTIKLTSLMRCFRFTPVVSLDLSNWDTSNVTNMKETFYLCKFLTSLDLSNWDTSNVTNMNQMFCECTMLTEVKMGGDVSNVTDVSGMFYNIKTTGTFYYNPQYDYSKIIAELPSTWTAVPME